MIHQATLAAEAPAVPNWAGRSAFVLALLGLGESIYLTYDHFTGTLPVCASHGAIDCQKVTTSAQSHVFGIPVALLGLIYFVFVVAVNVPALWRSLDVRVHWARLGLAVGGMGMVIYLLVAELFLIKAICLWCTGVHIITFLLFVLTVAFAPFMVGAGRGWDDEGEEWDQPS